MILSLNKVISVRSKETILKEGSNSDIDHQSVEHLFPVHNFYFLFISRSSDLNTSMFIYKCTINGSFKNMRIDFIP